jgi:predicted enzyme related to lactoylglutathione lyase
MTEAPESAGPHPRDVPGTPCWVSLMVHDLDAAHEFYAGLFGWEFAPGPGRFGPYGRALLDGREVAGMGHLPDSRLPVAWTPYFASDDVGATAETVRLCGGTIGVGPLDSDTAGRLAIGSDPPGAVFGLWQAAAHPVATVTGEPHTPVWSELWTFETANVTKFYASLFGYEEKRTEADPASGLPDDHVTLLLHGRPVACVHGLGPALPRDRGPHWMTYFEVTDTVAALARLTALGGQVLTPARDTTRGRLAVVSDREGARFALLQRTG